MPRLILVRLEDVPATLPLVTEWLHVVWGRGSRMPFKELTRRLIAGDYQLWLVRDDNTMAIVVTEIFETNTGRTGRITGLAGRDRKQWIHLIADLEEWMRGQGCVRSRIFGRKGWLEEDALAEYRTVSVVLEKEL